MQSVFFGWYSSMELNDDESARISRWTQVQAAAKAPSRGTLEALTRLAFRTKLSESEVGGIRSLFTSDAIQAPGDQELRLLAAATLATVLARRDMTAAKAAIFILTASCHGQRELQQPMDLIANAVDTLNLVSETVRRRPQLELERPIVPQLDGKALSDSLTAIDLATVQAVISTLVGNINKTLNAAGNRQKAFESAVQEYVRVQDEELDVLWWLHGKHSEIRNLPFREIPEIERPLVFAGDLAELTRVLPGPLSIRSLLSRAGIDDESTMTIPEAVQALPVGLLPRFVPDHVTSKVSVVTTPTLEAIRRRQEVDGRDAWAQTWAAVCGLDQDKKISMMHLAEAAYRELLLIKFG